ncbi:MAG: hypothetical protein AB8E15_04455 [Bdellovibrionales bacterium]
MIKIIVTLGILIAGIAQAKNVGQEEDLSLPLWNRIEILTKSIQDKLSESRNKNTETAKQELLKEPEESKPLVYKSDDQQEEDLSLPLWYRVEILAESIQDKPSESRNKITEAFRQELLKAREESRPPIYQYDDQVYFAIAAAGDYRLVRELMERFPRFTQNEFFAAYLNYERLNQYEKLDPKMTRTIKNIISDRNIYLGLKKHMYESGYYGLERMLDEDLLEESHEFSRFTKKLLSHLIESCIDVSTSLSMSNEFNGTWYGTLVDQLAVDIDSSECDRGYDPTSNRWHD